jgi:Domain of Unknown Function (DUF1080)
MRYLLFFLLLLCFSFQSPKEKGTQLFNGNNLDGWDTWLATPDSSYQIPGIERDANGKYTKPLGLNKDPLGVFTVSEKDGTPVIHISGQGFGAVTTKKEFDNFHLSIDYKWGEKKWAPRDKVKRDSGILYFCVGEHGAGGGAWMQSQECQVQEGDTGDYWSVGAAIADVKAEYTDLNGEQVLQFSPTASLKTIGKGFTGKNWNTLRCLKETTNEKPGEWNHIDIYTLNGKSVHVINGTTVMVLENSRHMVDGKEVPLTKGKIQIQTEGAEIFYRNIKVRAIQVIPATVLK